MTNSDILATVKEAVKVELNRQANEEIEKLVHKFRCELGKHKTEVIAGLANSLEVVAMREPPNNDVTIKINIYNKPKE